MSTGFLLRLTVFGAGYAAAIALAASGHLVIPALLWLFQTLFLELMVQAARQSRDDFKTLIVALYSKVSQEDLQQVFADEATRLAVDRLHKTEVSLKEGA